MKWLIETTRLRIRKLQLGDAKFVKKLMNQASYIEQIGDKKIRTIDDAVRYLKYGPLAMYDNYGLGLFAVESRELNLPIGVCGLIKRDQHEMIDLGFAFLEEFHGFGYAVESAIAVVDYGLQVLNLGQIVALVNPTNYRSIAVLEKVGFSYKCQIRTADNQELLNLMEYMVSDE